MHPVPASNPFALLLDPSAVLAEIAHSDRLNRLASRICRPLDKPSLQGAGTDAKQEPEIVTRDDDSYLPD